MAIDGDKLMRQAELGWLAARIDKDMPDAPATLWHYTEAAGLQGILTSQRIWATDARFLNDAVEISYGAKVFVDALMRYDVTALKPATADYVNEIRDPNRRLISNYFDDAVRVFAACFCAEPDLLSQWRAYAGSDRAGGYALGFQPPGPLPAWPQSAPGGHGLALRRVLYDEAEQVGEATALIDALVRVLDLDPGDMSVRAAFDTWLADGAVEFASWCKHPSFHEEREWRVVYVPRDDPAPLAVKHRPAGGILTPYVELYLPRSVGARPNDLPLVEVRCGPSPQPERKKAGVRSFLATTTEFSHVNVTGTTSSLIV